jgi:hypothetical protein
MCFPVQVRALTSAAAAGGAGGVTGIDGAAAGGIAATATASAVVPAAQSATCTHARAERERERERETETERESKAMSLPSLTSAAAADGPSEAGCDVDCAPAAIGEGCDGATSPPPLRFALARRFAALDNIHHFLRGGPCISNHP